MLVFTLYLSSVHSLFQTWINFKKPNSLNSTLLNIIAKYIYRNGHVDIYLYLYYKQASQRQRW